MNETIYNVPFELKSLSDSGEFTGIASVYGNVDLGNDVVDPGAFTKTIAERGDKVRLLDSHKTRIGIASVRELASGLEAKGKINLDKQAGREAYSDLKFYENEGLPMGMSIGYETLKAEPAHTSKDKARHLKEVKLWEVTVTEFPMNERAQVISVKSFKDLLESVKSRRGEQKDDFETELEELQLYSARYMMLQALDSALTEITWDAAMAADQKITASRVSIQQFEAAYMAMLPDYLSMRTDDIEEMSMPKLAEVKEGRMISAANRDKIQTVIDNLTALLSAEAGAVTGATSGEDGAAKARPEPVPDHSAAKSLISDIRSLIPAA
jgi:HK97 family phage prohead protease